jgi:hypothetical protein
VVIGKSAVRFLAVVPIVTLAAEPTWHVSTTKVEDYPGGFRCYFSAPTDKRDPPLPLFQANDDTSTDRHALIGIDGQRLVLDRVSLHVHSKDKTRVTLGDRLVERFVGKGVEVLLDATVTGACSPDDRENCEVTTYRAKLKVTKDGASRVLDLVGDCGS